MLCFVIEKQKERMTWKGERCFLYVEWIWAKSIKDAKERKGYGGGIEILAGKDVHHLGIGNRFNGIERIGKEIKQRFLGWRRYKESIFHNGLRKDGGNSGCGSGFSLGFVGGTEAEGSGKARGKGYSLSMISTEWLIMFWIKRSLKIFGRYINFPEGDKEYICVCNKSKLKTNKL